MSTKVKVISDGTPRNTRVEVDGKPLTNVARLLFCVDAEDGGTSWLTMELEGGVEIELDVEGTVLADRKKEEEKSGQQRDKPHSSTKH